MFKPNRNIATRKKRILIKIFALLVVLLLLLSTATYTWFALSKTPKVNDIAIYINSNTGMELSWDYSNKDGWGQHLDYSEKFPDRSVLKPVTYSFANDKFYAAKFGVDGKIEDISYALRDERNTNRSDDHGYYVKFSFYARSGEDVVVSLRDAEQNVGTYVIGTPKWDGENLIHVNGGGGAQYAIRIGFRITPIDENGNNSGESKFIIYEPNSTNHVNYRGDYITDYIETPSVDGTDNLVSNDLLIKQTSTLWTEMDPVQMELVEYKYGEFLDDTTLFTLNGGTTSKIDIYLWLEGQDVDCTNLIGHEAEIFSSIQFFAVAKPQSGMDTID